MKYEVKLTVSEVAGTCTLETQGAVYWAETKDEAMKVFLHCLRAMGEVRTEVKR